LLKNHVFAAVMIAALAVLLMAPAMAGAYCVYNHTNAELTVCGEFCDHCLSADLSAGEHACCPGGDKGCGGHTQITVSRVGPLASLCGAYKTREQVEAHGWVSIFGKCKSPKECCANRKDCCKLRVKIYRKDGSLQHEGRMENASRYCQ